MLIVLEAVRDNKLEDPSKLASFVFGTCRHVTWDLRRAAQRRLEIEREASSLDESFAPPSLSERDVVRLFRLPSTRCRERG